MTKNYNCIIMLCYCPFPHFAAFPCPQKDGDFVDKCEKLRLKYNKAGFLQGGSVGFSKIANCSAGVVIIWRII